VGLYKVGNLNILLGAISLIVAGLIAKALENRNPLKPEDNFL
jgi:hypothetical protein